MVNMRSYPVLYEQEDDGYFTVTCPLLEGCYSQGQTLKEATKNIKEAIELCLEGLDEDDIPSANNILVSYVVIP